MNSSVIPSELKCVIFDMDGVLYDSMKNHEATWVESFKNEGIEFPAYDAYLHEGRPGHETIGAVFQQFLNKEATPEDKERVYNEKVRLMSLAPEAEMMPMMLELIEMLRKMGIETRVVTGSKQPTLLDRLNKDFGFEPDKVISAKDVKQGKPHPEPYLKAVERSGFEAGECLVVENAPLGVESAKAAGIPTIAVNTGILKAEVLADAGADIVFPDTKSLFPYVSKYFEGRNTQ
ncbi:HAD family hydrolase [Plebeiibacterium marinum]|uniref:HAD-IA family hydrolase n=1 Tax=Plebeiibacterium marinum TaxID=2992111 RepID=A0AAE3SLE9_9BACT|nr:HAD-IA family hydrolase [Plebeiobacterium marinum]MCW3807815.1 HAD-IA family hydrolase [Plebeiobacterium marinum]